ncbi:MAG: DUF4130 domain-containing protein [Saccharofermentans sp.]|nr:DUF4130 domain-containing protein [Saccharofermentans sp.]
MQGRQYSYVYDGTFEGFLTVAVLCLRLQRAPAAIIPYYLSEDISDGSGPVNIRTNPADAEHLYTVLGCVADVQVQQNVSDFFLTCAEKKELTLFAYIYKALVTGSAISEEYKEPTVRAVRQAILDLYREAQSVQTDIGFIESDGISAAVINPRNSVLPVIRNQVLKREDLEDVALYDRRHCLLLRRKGELASLADIRHLALPEIGSPEDLLEAIGSEGKCWEMSGHESRHSLTLKSMWYIAS